MPPDPVYGTFDSAAAAPLLHRWGVNDVDRGLRNLQALAASIGPDCFGPIVEALGQFLPR